MKNSFRGAILKGVVFSGSDLRKSDFTGADLRGACFDDTDLRDSDFSGAIINNKTSFVAARLEGTKGLPDGIVRMNKNVISLKRERIKRNF